MAEPHDCMKASYCRHRDGSRRFDEVVAHLMGARWTDEQAAALIVLIKIGTAHLPAAPMTERA